MQLPKEFWAEVVHKIAYLVNRCPSSVIGFKTPMEMWSSSLCDYSNLRTFGYIAYAHQNEGKLEPRARKCIFVGYLDGVKGNKLWCPTTKKCFISMDVVFRECEFLKDDRETSTNKENGEVKDKLEFQMELKDKIDATEFEIEPQQYDIPLENYQLTRDRARKSIRPLQRFGYNDMVACSLSIGKELRCAEPKNYLETVSCKDSPKWMNAMQEEFESLFQNGTRLLVDKPKGCKVVGCKWVFKKKLGIPGVEPERFKARLVAKGYTQREGVDFNEIFSPAVKHTSIGVLLALVSLWNLEIEQMDVKTTFLHGELEEEIFMQQPEGFIVKGKENQVCLLKRLLYRLKQSPR